MGLHPTMRNPVMRAIARYTEQLGDYGQSCESIASILTELAELLAMQETHGPVYTMFELRQLPSNMALKLWLRNEKRFVFVRTPADGVKRSADIDDYGNGRISVDAVGGGMKYYHYNYCMFRVTNEDWATIRELEKSCPAQ